MARAMSSVAAQYSGTTRASRRRMKIRDPDVRAKSGAAAWTITKPEMAKNRSTPAAPTVNWGRRSSPQWTFRFTVMWNRVTPSAA
jgi:hypothetical protein